MKWTGFIVLLSVLVSPGLAGAGMVIGEVMSNPRGIESGAGSPGDRNEYVELYNGDSVEIDVVGWVLWDGDGYDFIEAWTDTTISDPDVVIDTTVIGPGSYAVILDPEYTSTGDSTFLQPYDFPPGTVILTVGNTTIGDGLSGTDPLSLGTPDTTFLDTYGTPADTTDTIPFDAGDGISIERIDARSPDSEDNWAPCRDSMGTPGSKNSVTGLLEGYLIDKRGMGLGVEAHPNPFQSQVVLSLSGERGRFPSAWICDVSGRRIADFGEVRLPCAVLWAGAGTPTGTYFCVVEDEGRRAALKVIRMR